MQRTCDHGIPLGAPCPDAACYNYQSPRPDPLPPAPRRDPDAELIAALSAPETPRYQMGTDADWDRMERLARRDNASGDLTHGRGFIGQREDGTTAPGSSSWEWMRVIGRENGREVRQDQPVFVKGAVYMTPTEARKVARERSELEAQRIIAEREFGSAAERSAGLSKDALGALLGMNPAQVRRGRRGA